MNEIATVLIVIVSIVFIYCAGFVSGETHTLKYVNRELDKINEPNNNNKR